MAIEDATKTAGRARSVLLDRLGEMMRDVAQREIVPRFQQLSASEIMGKPNPDDPYDLVTVADRAAEAELTLRLPSATVGPFGFTGMWSSALRAWLPHNRFSCPGAIVTPKVARPKWPRTT